MDDVHDVHCDLPLRELKLGIATRQQYRITVGPHLAMSLRILRLVVAGEEDIGLVLPLVSQFSHLEELSLRLIFTGCLSLEELLGDKGDEDKVASSSLKRFHLEMSYKGGPPEEVLQAEKLKRKFPSLTVAIWEHKDIFEMPVSDMIRLS